MEVRVEHIADARRISDKPHQHVVGTGALNIGFSRVGLPSFASPQHVRRFGYTDYVIQHEDFGPDWPAGFVRHKGRRAASRLAAVSAVFHRKWRSRLDAHHDFRRKLVARIGDQRPKCKDADCLLGMTALWSRRRWVDAGLVRPTSEDGLLHS